MGFETMILTRYFKRTDFQILLYFRNRETVSSNPKKVNLLYFTVLCFETLYKITFHPSALDLSNILLIELYMMIRQLSFFSHHFILQVSFFIKNLLGGNMKQMDILNCYKWYCSRFISQNIMKQNYSCFIKIEMLNGKYFA